MKIFYPLLKSKAVLLLAAFLLPAVLQAQLRLSTPTTGDYSSTESIFLLPGFSTSGPFRAYISSNLNIKLGSSPSSGQNYVRTQTYKEPSNVPFADPTVSQVSEVIQYIDGLGRPMQTVQTKGSPQGNDIVQPIAYDQFGRESLKYLPYAEQSGGGMYRTDALSRQLSFYSSSGWDGNVVKTGAPYSQTVFEASPLNRVNEQGAFGSVWQPAADRNSNGGRTVVVENGTNAASSVVLWNANSTGADFHPILSANGYYGAGQLYLKRIKDENWVPADGASGTTEEYTDKEGHMVLKRIFNGSEVLSTYYVYDDFGNLSFVLPPGSKPDAASISNTLFEQFCYQYAYDGRQRLVGKRLPGTGDWTEMVYNPLDQLVFSQDPLERAGERRSFIKYDGLGRVVMSGQEKKSTLDRNAIQAVVNSWPEQWEHRDNSNDFFAYSNSSVPSNVANIEVEVVNYYDNYDIPSLPDNASGSYSNQTRGLLTASLTRVLGTNDFLWTVNYYDEKGRLASQYRQHYLKGSVDPGNYDRIVNAYNFEGALTASTRQHYSITGGVTTITNRYVYDHVGRKLQSLEKINANDEVLLVENRYNELGQLKEKALHNKEQQTSYAYNERGWLKNSRSAQFSQDLRYQDGATPQFNGNISEQYWGSGASLNRSFSYAYDKLNRLTSGVSIGMSEIISYDVMGNIKSLNRDGTARAYNYVGNQLQSVTGMSAYAYDANGNATTDGRSGNIISYNRLNLPAGVAALNLSYVYDATGNKLKKKSGTKVTDYINGIQYMDGALELIQTETGVARKNGLDYSYEYNLTDHLGNVRYTFYKNPVSKLIERLQSDDYYPFGLRKLVQEGSNKYLYNGKELQDELGQYDYGARFYDPVIARWNVVDPLAEKMRNWSPYNYAFNNPIRFIDVGGMFPYPVTVRAFAPSGAFRGSGFGDDRRGYSSSTGVTSRISQTTTIDPTARTVSGGAATSSDTHWNGFNVGNATSSNEGGVGRTSFFKNSFGSNVAAVDASFSGSNPAFGGTAPNIDVKSSILLSENTKEGYVNASIDLSSKQFPATEAIIGDSKGQSVFLTGAAAFGGAGDLMNADVKQVSSVDIRININDKGEFQSVMFGGKTYKIGDWNKMQTAKPAGPFERKKEDENK